MEETTSKRGTLDPGFNTDVPGIALPRMLAKEY